MKINTFLQHLQNYSDLILAKLELKIQILKCCISKWRTLAHNFSSDLIFISTKSVKNDKIRARLHKLNVLQFLTILAEKWPNSAISGAFLGKNLLMNVLSNFTTQDILYLTT